MDQAVTMKYMRASQQLQRKTEELEKVFEEAQALERQNMRLSAENRELKARNEVLENDAGRKDHEFRMLEQQVKKQQQKLQTYIDNEVKNSQVAVQPREMPAAPRESSIPNAKAHTNNEPAVKEDNNMMPMKLADAVKELANVKRRLGATEEARRAAVEASEEYKKGTNMLLEELKQVKEEKDKLGSEAEKQIAGLQADLDAVKKSETALKDVIHQLKEHNALVVSESEKMDDIETKAREGLKAEWMAISAENRKLKEKLAHEIEQYNAAKGEFARFEDLVKAERLLADEHAKIAADELAAVNAQHEMMLTDLRRVVADRDSLRRQLHLKEEEVESKNLIMAARAAREVLETDEMTPPPAASPQQQQQKPATPSPEHQRAYNEATARLEQALSDLESTRQELQEVRGKTSTLEEQLQAREKDCNGLEDDVSELRALLREKTENEQLRDEQIELQRGENRQLLTDIEQLRVELKDRQKQMFDQVLSPTKTVAAASPKEVVDPMILKDLMVLVKKLLLLGQKTLNLSRKSDQTSHSHQRSASNMSTDSLTAEAENSYPIQPCSKYTSEELNMLFGHLGGLEYVLKVLRREVWDVRHPGRAVGGSVQREASVGRGTNYKEDLLRLPNNSHSNAGGGPSVDPMSYLMGNHSYNNSQLPPKANTGGGGLSAPGGESLLEAANSASLSASPNHWQDRRINLLQEQVSSLLSNN